MGIRRELRRSARQLRRRLAGRRAETAGEAEAGLGLAWMVAPVAVEAFLAGHWERRRLHVPGTPERFAALPGLRELDDVMGAALDADDSVQTAGRMHEPEDWRTLGSLRRAMGSGASVRIPSVQRFSAPLRALCRTLARELSAGVNVNLYWTPPGQPGLKRHYDTHDVYVLQTGGRKKWRLYGPAVEVPLGAVAQLNGEAEGNPERRAVMTRPRTSAEDCELIEELVLEPGATLYLPRGLWHEAETMPGAPSLHLAVGVHAPTYLDLLAAMAAAAAGGEARLRRALPPGFARDAAARRAIAAEAAGLWEAAGRGIDPAAALEAMAPGYDGTEEAEG